MCDREPGLDASFQLEGSVTSPGAVDGDDYETLIATLTEQGGQLSNARLKDTLDWAEERYWAVRNSLVEEGRLEIGRGRGGTVRLLAERIQDQEVAPEDAPIVRLEREVVDRESSLYSPMQEVIRSDWAKDERFDFLAVEVTAQQGRRQTGGRFSRPDIVAVEVRIPRYLPTKSLEVVTFEVKASFAVDVTAVYEALAHWRAATRSYVILHVPDPDERRAEVDAIEEAARDHGIGLILAELPEDYATWTTLVDAERHEPDPRRLDDFIHIQLSEATRELIRQRIR